MASFFRPSAAFKTQLPMGNGAIVVSDDGEDDDNEKKNNIKNANNNRAAATGRGIGAQDCFRQLGLTNIDIDELLDKSIWLSDRHIDAAQKLFQIVSPAVQLDSPLMSQLNFRPATLQGLQSHHDTDHWLLSSTLKGHVEIYNSLSQDNLSDEIKRQLLQRYANLITPAGDGVLTVHIVRSVTIQRSLSACGLHVIANMAELLLGGDPKSVIYDEKEMRGHLLNCFQNGFMERFPSRPRKGPIKESTVIRIPSNFQQTEGDADEPRNSKRRRKNYCY